jgi:hypothetical protein
MSFCFPKWHCTTTCGDYKKNPRLISTIRAKETGFSIIFAISVQEKAGVLLKCTKKYPPKSGSVGCVFGIK